MHLVFTYVLFTKPWHRPKAQHPRGDTLQPSAFPESTLSHFLVSSFPSTHWPATAGSQLFWLNLSCAVPMASQPRRMEEGTIQNDSSQCIPAKKSMCCQVSVSPLTLTQLGFTMWLNMTVHPPISIVLVLGSQAYATAPNPKWCWGIEPGVCAC